MTLPETQNANFQYAFKKGYRMAQDGKSMTQMPSSIRHNADMRDYFQQGWTQFENDFASAENEQTSPWRNRLIWGFMAMIAGVGTAKLLIDNIQNNNRALAEKTSAPTAQMITESPTTHPTTPQSTQDTVAKIDQPKIKINQPNQLNPTQTATPKFATSNALSLLNPAERKDLKLNQQEAHSRARVNAEKIVTLSPITHPSGIQIAKTLFSTQILNKQPVHILTENTVIPKHIRQLYFFTVIQSKQPQLIYHRWIYKNKIMATIALKTKPGSYRTWSSKRLSSAWQGAWRVEILDSKKQVIYRQTFKYIE